MELERVVCRVKEADVEKKTLETRVNELSEALLGAEEAFREADKVAYELRAEIVAEYGLGYEDAPPVLMYDGEGGGFSARLPPQCLGEAAEAGPELHL